MGVSLCRWNLLAVLALAVAAPADVTATKLDGTIAAGQLQSWSADEMSFTQPPPGSKPFPPPICSRSILHAGDSRRRQAAAGAHGRHHVAVDDFTTAGNSANTRLLLPSQAEPQALTMPLDKVRAVRLQPLDAEVLPAMARDSQARRAKRLDRRLKRGGKSLDHWSACSASIRTEVEIQARRQEVRMPRSKVAGLIYYRSEDADAKSPPCVLVGSRRPPRSRAKYGSLARTTALIAETSRPDNSPGRSRASSFADLSAGKIVYLSDTEPASAAWHTARRPADCRIAGRPNSANPASINPPAADRSRSLSRDRRSSGGHGRNKSFAKGLAIRSRTELVYRLPAGYRHFLAEAGIDPLPSASGNVMLSIFGDERLLVEQAIAGTDAPMPLDLDITGVKRLKIVVDYGQNLDTGDWLNCATRES